MANKIEITRKAFRPVFHCQLTRTSASVLTLSRFTGAWLMIAGETYLIPSAGLTVGNGGLANSTTYYVYAYDDGTSDHNPTLEINTTIPVIDTTYGHLVKTGDATRTYVGRWTTDGSAQFVAAAFTTYGQRVYSAPLSLSSLGVLSITGGTTGTVLKGVTGDVPVFGAVSLTADVSGVLPASLGGTGVANNIACTWAISGSFATTITLTGVTGITLPTAGTLATLAGSESLTNKTLGATTLSGTISGGGNQINNVIIGTTTPLAGLFTTVSASTSVTSPLVIGGSGTTGTQLTFKTTTGNGTTDAFAFVGGNNGATAFGDVTSVRWNIPQTTDSTTKTTGAIVTAGGIGASKGINAPLMTARQVTDSQTVGGFQFVNSAGTGTGGMFMGGDNNSYLFTQTSQLYYIVDIAGTFFLELAGTYTKVRPSTASTSTTTGSLQVAGGMGVVGAGFFGAPVVVKNYTVATLPTAATYQYGFAFVTDATLTTITGLGLAPTGGGANKVPVYSDGTNWLML